MDLSDGSRVTLERLPAVSAPFAGWTTRTTVVLLVGSTRLTLVLKQRERLTESAALAGAALVDAPFLFHLVLAVIAQHGQLPDQRILTVLMGIDESVRDQITATAPVLPRAAMRTLAGDALHAERIGLELPPGSWNAARTLLAIGAQAWHLIGADAAWWGSVPTVWVSDADVGAQWQRMLLANLAGLAATPALRAGLALTVAPDASLVEVWIDWISLVVGPGAPPTMLRPAGLGAFGDTPLEAANTTHGLDMSGATGAALDQLAATLLAAAARPVPRHIGRIMDVAIPADVVPQLAAWGIAALRVQPHAQGLWFAALDATDRSIGAAWWRAVSASSTRSPLTFPPAAWALVHPVLAALWHDLCADAIQVEAPAAPPHAATQRDAVPRAQRHGRASITLPPVQVARAVWADAADRQALARARQAGNGYRRLPAGWEARQHARDFRKRQTLAAERAAHYQSPAPPLGFTFIKPFVIGAGEQAAPDAVPQVRARGLFAVLLGLADLAEAVEDIR